MEKEEKTKNWKERFRIKVRGLDYNLGKFSVPRGFIKTHSSRYEDLDYYWFICFVPFVKFGLWFQKVWWIIPKWLYKKGHFQHSEGETESWFWLKKVRLTSTKVAVQKRQIQQLKAEIQHLKTKLKIADDRWKHYEPYYLEAMGKKAEDDYVKWENVKEEKI